MKITRLKGGHLTATFRVAIEDAPIELTVDLPLEDVDEAILQLIERATEKRDISNAARRPTVRPVQPLTFAAEPANDSGYVVLRFRLHGGGEQSYLIRADAADDLCDEVQRAAADARSAPY